MSLSYIVKAIVNIVLAFVGTLLGLRFLLKLFAANPNNEFAHWVYETSSQILGPFRNLFPQTTLNNGVQIEFSVLFALMVYGLIGMLVVYLVDLMTPPAVVETKARRVR